MKLLVLDNYDSFTYNLVQLIKELGYRDVTVIRNNKLTVEEVEAYDAVLLSPGPGLPWEAGLMMEIIERYAPTKRILGVCLGHQALAASFGGKLYNMSSVLHGVATEAEVVADDVLFEGVPRTFKVGRYHSWSVEDESIPADIIVTARDQHGRVLALRHRDYDVRGLQFHPESVLTEHGIQILDNWLKAKPESK